MEANAFEDVNYDLYYGNAINWARATGVVSGYKDKQGVYRTFKPNNAVTRQELCIMFCNYARVVEGVDTAVDAELLATYPDFNKVPEWSKPSMAWCVDAGLITGVKVKDVDHLKPTDKAWRAVMIQRYQNNVALGNVEEAETEQPQ